MDEDFSLREMEFTLRFPDVTLDLLGSKSLLDSKGQAGEVRSGSLSFN